MAIKTKKRLQSAIIIQLYELYKQKCSLLLKDIYAKETELDIK